MTKEAPFDFSNPSGERPMLERILLGYPIGTLRELANILQLMKRHDVSVDEFLDKVDTLFNRVNIYDFERSKQIQLAINKYKALARRCVCGNVMRIARVNDSPASQVGGDFKSMWFCPDAINCGETVYSTLDLREEADRYDVGELVDSMVRKRGTPKDLSRKQARQKNAAQRRPCNRANRR